MVARYLEILVGIRMTNTQACELFLPGYKELSENEKENVIFSVEEYDTKQPLLKGKVVRQEICCSSEQWVYIGKVVRRVYRKHVEKCEKCTHSLCDNCFSTTEQGVISYEQTYNNKKEQDGSLDCRMVCGRCFSYNSYQKDEDICKVCNGNWETFCNFTFKYEEMEFTGKYWAVWNDCCSCT